MNEPFEYAQVAVSGPLRRDFLYRVPESLGPLDPGQRLLVPFGRRRQVGFYLRQSQPIPGIHIKQIVRPLDPASYIPPELFDLCTWMADYYFANPADCLSATLPPGLKSSRSVILTWGRSDLNLPLMTDRLRSSYRPGRKLNGETVALIDQTGKALLEKLIESGTIVEKWPGEDLESKKRLAGYRGTDPIEWADHFRLSSFQPRPFDGIRSRLLLKEQGWTDYQIRKGVKAAVLLPEYLSEAGDIMAFVEPKTDVIQLHPGAEQEVVCDRLKDSLQRGFSVHLLHGVTGSGKTLVYCHTSAELLKQGKTVLVLTPEISLAGSILAYFRGFFGDRVTVIHSAMTNRERLSSWRGIRAGRFQIVVGPRSALFAPLPNLGMIIVDEEHDPSYKQDDPSPRFQGRDSAIMRAKLNSIPILLGSATPSLESYQHALENRYHLLELKERPTGASLPNIHLADMRSQGLRGEHSYLSLPLKKKIESTLKAEKQVILFLNRRGYSPHLKCADCGHSPECPDCRIKLTYHKRGSKLTCHYCGHLAVADSFCENCHGNRIDYIGVGTQRLEESLSELFQSAKVVRFDSDSASGRKKAHSILSSFARQEGNLLLGTQMVTKGLDLPGVTLVGVVSADASMDMPDFRASEKAFSRLVQVSGRSGRADVPGEVIIQTFNPDNEVIGYAAGGNYRAFFDREIKSRRELSYPPFSRLINFVFSGDDDNKLQRAALEFKDRLLKRTAQAKLNIVILGPAPCPLAYLRKHYRRHMLVKTKQTVRLVRLLTQWEENESGFKLPGSVKLVVDVDPDDMM